MCLKEPIYYHYQNALLSRYYRIVFGSALCEVNTDTSSIGASNSGLPMVTKTLGIPQSGTLAIDPTWSRTEGLRCNAVALPFGTVLYRSGSGYRHATRDPCNNREHGGLAHGLAELDHDIDLRGSQRLEKRFRNTGKGGIVNIEIGPV